jgi:hypothetical protein
MMQISTEIVVALIALFGVLLPILVSLFVSKKTISTELRKLRFQAEQVFWSEILKRRMDTYPQLYYLLSEFNKKIEFTHQISKTDIESLSVKINEWDSENAIVFSRRTATLCYRFREMLWELIEESDEELKKKLSNQELLRDIYQKTGTLELALKSDLGIYGVDVSNAEDNIKTMRTLREEAEKYEHESG